MNQQELDKEAHQRVRCLFRSNVDLRHAVNRTRRFNESLVEQVADANERIAVLENRLRGNNAIRTIARKHQVPQEEIVASLDEFTKQWRQAKRAQCTSS